MNIRLIATDLDGTLLNTKETISDYTADVLCRASQLGYFVVPSTGRSLYALPPVLDRLSPKYLLINSGATVIERKTGHYIYSAPISHDTLSRFFRMIDGYRIECNLACEHGPYMLRSHYESHLEGIRSSHRKNDFWLDFYLYKVKTFEDFQRWLADTNPTVFKINLYLRDEKSRAEIPAQMKDFPDLFVCHTPGGDLEITDVHATKGQGLLALAAHLGLSAEQIIAFGDTDNDIDMLETAGIGVAMANALPVAKAAADRITRSNDEDGVAWAVEHWVFNQLDEV